MHRKRRGVLAISDDGTITLDSTIIIGKVEFKSKKQAELHQSQLEQDNNCESILQNNIVLLYKKELPSKIKVDYYLVNQIRELASNNGSLNLLIYQDGTGYIIDETNENRLIKITTQEET